MVAAPTSWAARRAAPGPEWPQGRGVEDPACIQPVDDTKGEGKLREQQQDTAQAPPGDAPGVDGILNGHPGAHGLPDSCILIVIISAHAPLQVYPV